VSTPAFDTPALSREYHPHSRQGALLGAAIGRIGESWEVVSTDELQVSIALPPAAAGPGVVVALRF
jgi:hypothetical protein